MSAATQHVSRILVIDDTKTDRDLFKYLLTQSGFYVETAADGEEALAALKKGEFDLALCDYLMPNMDGLEFLLKMRQDSRLSHVIVIIITSDETEETKVKLLKAGANDFIHKGVSKNEVVARIRVHLDAQNAQVNRKILEVAGEMANSINQPLSVLVAALDVLKEMVQSLSAGQKEEFMEALKTINKQADSMIVTSENLKRLALDTRKHYKVDKKA